MAAHDARKLKTAHSMTGFARAAGHAGELAFAWELKSVNGRGLDLRFRLPPGFDALESPARQAVQAAFKRGSFQIALSVQSAAVSKPLTVNWTALDQVLAALKALEGKVAAEPPRLDGLLAIKGVLESAETPETDESRADRDQTLLKAFQEGLAALARSRGEEGARLIAVLMSQIDGIETLTAKAKELAAGQAGLIKARLEQNLEALMTAQPALPADRIAQEAALLMVKADVREEIDRLTAHVAQARDLLGSGEPQGRKLDFLAQEFNREANTLCSKAVDIELTRIGIELKTLIDQWREQVQNLE